MRRGASFDPHVGHEEREVLPGEVKVGGQAALSARPEEVEAHRPPRGRRPITNTTTTAAAAAAAPRRHGPLVVGLEACRAVPSAP